MPTARSRRRAAPPVTDIIDAAKTVISHYTGGGKAVRFDIVAGFVRRQLATSGPLAREWLRMALTDPAQSELVWLVSTDNKWVQRVVRREGDPGKYNKYTRAENLVDGESDTTFLYLDRSGCPLDSGDDAIRNVYWVVTKSAFDGFVAALRQRREEEQAHAAHRQGIEDSRTETLIGGQLSFLRGMLAEAGIDLTERRPQARILAHAQTVNREGRLHQYSRASIELEGKALLQLATWLRDKGVTPQPAPDKTIGE